MCRFSETPQEQPQKNLNHDPPDFFELEQWQAASSETHIDKSSKRISSSLGIT